MYLCMYVCLYVCMFSHDLTNGDINGNWNYIVETIRIMGTKKGGPQIHGWKMEFYSFFNNIFLRSENQTPKLGFSRHNMLSKRK